MVSSDQSLALHADTHHIQFYRRNCPRLALPAPRTLSQVILDIGDIARHILMH